MMQNDSNTVLKNLHFTASNEFSNRVHPHVANGAIDAQQLISKGSFECISKMTISNIHSH